MSGFVLEHIDIEVNHRCNLACRHCSARAAKGRTTDELNVEQIQEMFDKFGRYVATKEDIQKAVSYLDNRIQNIMRQPLSTSEQLQLISDATAAFSYVTTSVKAKSEVKGKLTLIPKNNNENKPSNQ